MHFGSRLPFESVCRGVEFFVGHALACPGERSSPLCFGHLSSATGFSPPRNKPVAAAGGVYSAFCPNRRRSEAGEICRAPWKPAKGELRSPDKLKHVPRKRPNSSRQRSSPVTAFQPVACHSITVRRRSRPRPAEYSGLRGRNCRGRTSPSRRPGGRSCRDRSRARGPRLHPS